MFQSRTAFPPAFVFCSALLAAIAACSAPPGDALDSTSEDIRGCHGKGANACDAGGGKGHGHDGGVDDEDGGEDEDGEAPKPTRDAGPTPAPDAGVPQPTPDASAPPPPPPPADAGSTSSCINAVASPGSGHHNPGADCMSCHANISGAQWTVAGTLYNTATGTAPISGATIEVIDAKGQTLRLPTYDNGNFFTTTPVTLPLKVRASKCPADAAMVSTAGQGSCNGCHNSAMRIHLP